MTNYDDDELDEEIENEEPASVDETGGSRPSGSRNFLIALGVLGLIFILVAAVLLILYFNRTGGKGAQTANINATNVAIQTANAQTAVAATLTSAVRAIEMQATSTPIPTDTPVPAKLTPTSVLAQPTDTPESGGLASPTANAQTQTRSAPAALTQAAQQTKTRQASINLTATATSLPDTGFAEDVGLPGLFAMALGLGLLIILVRRLRFSGAR